MKVLQVCHKPPKPELDGGALAINQITEGLLDAGVDLDLLFVETSKHPFESALFNDNRLVNKIHAVFIDTEISPQKALVSFLANRNFNLSRFKSAAFEEKLIELLQKGKYDIVHLESLYVGIYVDVIKRVAPKAKIVYRSHNIEHLIWERLTKQAKGLKKIYLNSLAKSLKKEEIAIVKKMDAIASISKNEIGFFKHLGIKTVINIPFGIDINTEQSNEKHSPIRFFHLASMDWMPNIEAVKALLDEVWPKFLHNEKVELHIAGRHMPKEFLDFNGKGNIRVSERVESAEQFIRENDVLILPLQSGGGIRIKVLEAMKYSKCIVSTRVGTEGIDLENNKEALIVDHVGLLPDAIQKVIETPLLIAECGKAAFKKAKTNYDKSEIIKQLIRLYHDC